MFYRPHPRVSLDCGDHLITKQSHKAECDIHNILRQYQRTGILEHVARGQQAFIELPDALDYQASLHVIANAQAAFAALPSTVRDHFSNSPELFLSAFTDPTQHSTLADLGLLTTPPTSSSSTTTSSTTTDSNST